jgi:hypothetical protein
MFLFFILQKKITLIRGTHCYESVMTRHLRSRGSLSLRPPSTKFGARPVLFLQNVGNLEVRGYDNNQWRQFYTTYLENWLIAEDVRGGPTRSQLDDVISLFSFNKAEQVQIILFTTRFD